MSHGRSIKMGRLMDRDVRITRDNTNGFVRQLKVRMDIRMLVMRVNRRCRERYRYGYRMRNFDRTRNVDWNWTINLDGIRLLDDDWNWMRNRNLHRTFHFDRDVLRNWYWDVTIDRYWFWHRYGHFDDVVHYVL